MFLPEPGIICASTQRRKRRCSGCVRHGACAQNKCNVKSTHTKRRGVRWLQNGCASETGDVGVELLLWVTLNYKTTKLQKNVDWESCQSKYSNIMDTCQMQYRGRSRERVSLMPLQKARSPSKVRTIMTNRQAVDTGHQSGQGRVVLLFFELCEEIWGGSPATRTIDAGIERGGLEELSSTQSSSTALDCLNNSPDSIHSSETLPPSVVKQCKDMIQVWP